LDHVGTWLRANAKARPRLLARLVRQVIRSWYIGVFELPGVARLASLGARRRGLEPRTVLNGASMYKQNMRVRLRNARATHTDVPVQLVVPTRDPFVSLALLDGIENVAPKLWRRRLRAGHWVMRSRPDVLARWIS